MSYYKTYHIQEMYKQKKLLDKTKIYGKIPPDECYVYLVMCGSIVVYIGKGTGWRFLHPNTGRSSCIELNRGHFNGLVYDVYLLKHQMTDELALELEKDAIEEFRPIYNVKC